MANAKAEPRSEWDQVWDWAHEVWGPTTELDKVQVTLFCGNSRFADDRACELTFSWFFRDLASKRAQAEGWEELGSSDVWCACFDSVKRIKEEGKTTTRADLMKRAREWMGY